MHALKLAGPVLFLSTLSLRRATGATKSDPEASNHFYPRSPCGERRGGHISQTRNEDFYPRSPCGERRNSETQADPVKSISIHALLAESDDDLGDRLANYCISIHALLAESDVRVYELVWGVSISIHALLAESDLFA